ncbi:MAG: hypothetical protein CSA22_08665 [Deltaproteobacteria bacterium]|nr:MAG: hypothetical protein CSA22_08665 [Deltaproteobacteria bacterium]
MAYWKYREDLSLSDRLRRSYYELLRDDLDQFVLQYALVDSYQNFIDAGLPYPFVERRELKPRARIPDVEYEHQNSMLLIFLEDQIESAHKKYVRFFDANKSTKANLIKSEVFSLMEEDFDRSCKFLDAVSFYDFLRSLLPVDYALLIQPDPSVKKARYALTHFHVRIDWPIAEAAEELARSLRYISKDLYEKGDKYAEDIQKKFFEYYNLTSMAGGRRTAAIVAAQYLRKIHCIHTVYVGSSESRTLNRISERGNTRFVLVKFTRKEMRQLAENNNMPLETVLADYPVAWEGQEAVLIFQVIYANTSHSQVPEDGKLRELNPDRNWLTVSQERILPKPGSWSSPPLALNLVYA